MLERGHAVAGADNLWIEARRGDGQLTITARDDGRGAETIVPGNGLRGMRERLVQQGGTLHVESQAQGGFRLRLAMPVGPSLAEAPATA